MLLEFADIALPQLEGRQAELGGADDDLIIYVGEVHHLAHLVAAEFQVATDDIEHYRAHGMPYMGFVVHCRTTDVHSHLHGREWLEDFLSAGERVIDA